MDYFFIKFILILQVITLSLFIPVLYKLFFNDDIKEGVKVLKEYIIEYLKNDFKFLQDKINKIYEFEIAEFSKLATSNLQTYNTLNMLELKIDAYKAISTTNLSQVTLNHIINLSDFEIFYFTPYDGYLSIEGEYCELHFMDNSQIIVKKHLKNFFFEARKTISIRNIKNLQNIRFDKKDKSKN